MKNLIEFVKTNKKEILKRTLVVGGVVTAGVLTAMAIKNNVEGDESYELLEGELVFEEAASEDVE